MTRIFIVASGRPGLKIISKCERIPYDTYVIKTSQTVKANPTIAIEGEVYDIESLAGFETPLHIWSSVRNRRSLFRPEDELGQFKQLHKCFEALKKEIPEEQEEARAYARKISRILGREEEISETEFSRLLGEVLEAFKEVNANINPMEHDTSLAQRLVWSKPRQSIIKDSAKVLSDQRIRAELNSFIPGRIDQLLDGKIMLRQKDKDMLHKQINLQTNNRDTKSVGLSVVLKALVSQVVITNSIPDRDSLLFITEVLDVMPNPVEDVISYIPLAEAEDIELMPNLESMLSRM